MTNSDYWKERYQQSWDKASYREKVIAERIRNETGKTAEYIGLGTGSAGFLSGSAASRGYEKGGADLHIVGTNMYLEVTGPQLKSVLLKSDLWIRPDKVTNAEAHVRDHETWLVHWLERDGTLRVIHFNENFFALVDSNAFLTINPRIRGAIETYISIPASHPCVQPWEMLRRRLNQLP